MIGSISGRAVHFANRPRTLRQRRVSLWKPCPKKHGRTLSMKALLIETGEIAAGAIDEGEPIRWVVSVRISARGRR